MTAKQDDGSIANARNLLVSCASFMGGPLVGIPTTVFVTAERFAMGGPTAVPCCIATLMASIISSLLYRFAGNKFPPVIIATLYMLAMETIHLFLIGIMYDGYQFGGAATEILGSALGMFLCTYIYFREVERRRGKGEIPWI